MEEQQRADETPFEAAARRWVRGLTRRDFDSLILLVYAEVLRRQNDGALPRHPPSRKTTTKVFIRVLDLDRGADWKTTRAAIKRAATAAGGKPSDVWVAHREGRALITYECDDAREAIDACIRRCVEVCSNMALLDPRFASCALYHGSEDEWLFD